jgi:signal transduction histidine kinase
VVGFPLTYAGETVGDLVAAPRGPREPLSTADRRLLEDLARPIGATAHAARLAADLDHARLRLVTAREEARRRLGSDLHDGIGHQLAGLGRRMEQATDRLRQDPEAARQILVEVSQQLRDATLQVRELAHQLHPPELELLGLVGALCERAQTQDQLRVRLDMPSHLPPLPTAVETAAYYIALEALANAAKHSGAATCLLRLALRPAENGTATLELDIRDDGHGLRRAEPANGRGLGLLSMRARAAEVGGDCTIGPGPNGGLWVSARLPCPAG